MSGDVTCAVRASRMSRQWILSPGTRGRSMWISLMVFGLGILRGSFSVSQKFDSSLWTRTDQDQDQIYHIHMVAIFCSDRGMLAPSEENGHRVIMVTGWDSPVLYEL